MGALTVRLALTGAPGTGKTTLAGLLMSAYDVHAVRTLAEACGALGTVEDDGAHPIDLALLSTYVERLEGDVLVEGHLSHHLHPDAIVVLRCAPSILSERLRMRGYGASKIQANTEWELLGGVHAELRDAEVDVPMLELDATSVGPDALAAQVLAWRDGGYARQIEPLIDWLADPNHLPS
ncbi:MAG: AAA family ATPase [Candidatus Poseidoniaceae archaeon]|nr:AAA family ATPase [Candidatus Poseidoniaceae archaeon]